MTTNFAILGFVMRMFHVFSIIANQGVCLYAQIILPLGEEHWQN